jgi:hypothetical protein
MRKASIVKWGEVGRVGFLMRREGCNAVDVVALLAFPSRWVVEGGGSFERGISTRERAGAFKARSGIHAPRMDESDGHDCSAD